jgi:NAD(P)-dependent dehydrogenase (short-subunit alcohol dehydrogenase family)
MPAAYSAIKGGLINFTRYLSSYLGKNNIRVNAISPGGIYNNQDLRFVGKYNEKVPLGRMGKPSDISPAVVFLLSEDSSYITGQNIIIDGGWTSI